MKIVAVSKYDNSDNFLAIKENTESLTVFFFIKMTYTA